MLAFEQRHPAWTLVSKNYQATQRRVSIHVTTASRLEATSMDEGGAAVLQLFSPYPVPDAVAARTPHPPLPRVASNVAIDVQMASVLTAFSRNATALVAGIGAVLIGANLTFMMTFTSRALATGRHARAVHTNGTRVAQTALWSVTMSSVTAMGRIDGGTAVGSISAYSLCSYSVSGGAAWLIYIFPSSEIYSSTLVPVTTVASVQSEATYALVNMNVSVIGEWLLSIHGSGVHASSSNSAASADAAGGNVSAIKLRAADVGKVGMISVQSGSTVVASTAHRVGEPRGWVEAVTFSDASTARRCMPLST